MDTQQLEKLKKQELSVVRTLLKRQNEMLGQSLLHLDHLIFLQKSISLLSSREIYRVLVDKLPPILCIKYYSLFLYDKIRKTFRLTSHNHPDWNGDFEISLEESEIMGEAVRRGRYILEQDFPKSRYFKGKKNPLFENHFFLTIPLMIENEIVGVLNLNDCQAGYFTVSDLDFALNVAEFISLSINNALSYEKAERLSVTDGLTGLNNHQQMETLLRREVHRSRRYCSPLSLIILDIDHFKRINDTYGHQAGDEVLIAVASFLEEMCRENDIAARYGGEEFVLILPETPSSGAFQIAERLRQTISQRCFPHEKGDYSITLSGGISEFDAEKMTDHSDLIRVADQALYQAKESGRNCTVTLRPDDLPQD